MKYLLLQEKNSDLDLAIADIEQADVLAVDTETTGLDCFRNRLVLVQIGTPDMAYIFDWDAADFRAELTPVLENPDIPKLMHNAKFDYKFLKAQAGISCRHIYDTMLAEKTLTLGTRTSVSLKNIVKRRYGFEMDKTIRTTFGAAGLNKDQLAYAADDVIFLHMLYDDQQQEINRKDLGPTIDLENQTVIPVAEMELNGMRIDLDTWRSILAEEQAAADQALAEMIKLAAPYTSQTSMFGVAPFNPDSQPDILAILQTMGCDIKDTDSKTLKKIDHPMVDALLNYRAPKKILSTYGEDLLGKIHPATDRIHPEFRQLGTYTGRFSSSSPNAQNIPVFLRKLFVSPPGYKMITADYSQAELRIIAELSEDTELVEAFHKGIDVHSLVASKVFNQPISKCGKDSIYRKKAKSVNYGLAYGESAWGLGRQLNIPVEEAEQILQDYFDIYHRTKEWLDSAGARAIKRGYSVTPLGRRRYYNIPPKPTGKTKDKWRDYYRKIRSIERQGMNMPIQGCSADMTKLAMVLVFNTLQNYDAKLVSTVHDEVVLEVREDQAQEVADIVRQCLLDAANKFLPHTPMEVDLKIDTHWTK